MNEFETTLVIIFVFCLGVVTATALFYDNDKD